MAENKKSFIAYSDWKDTFDLIPDEIAGKLIKHIFAYVNDENPTTDDYVINGLFANIKNTLKRDLKKWEAQHNQRVDAGKKSAEIRKRNATVVNGRSVSSTVSVSVSDSDNDNETDNKEKKVFNFSKSILELGVEKQIKEDWLKVRTKKRAVNSETAFKDIEKQIKLSGLSANECITISVENSWAGFKSSWLKNKTNEKNWNGNRTGFASDTTKQTIAIIQAGFE